MGKGLRGLDWPIVIVPLLLLLFGIAVIYTVTFPTVQFALARSQIIFALLGLITAFILAALDYRSWQSLSYFLYIVGLALLGIVLVAGAKTFGAARWIDLGFFQLQPSEIMKLIVIFIEAHLLAMWAGKMSPWRLILFLVTAAVPVAFVLRQPDLGTAGVLVAITFGLLLFAKLPLRWWAAMGVIAALLAPVAYLNLHDYQKTRIKVFLSPQHDETGQGYNVRQAAIAIGSGGLIGQGLGQGSQSQLNFLPVAHTDFIFAGLAEATGLLGSAIILGLYSILTARIFRVAERAKDEFGSFLALGIGIMFAFQILINIGMNLGLVPVTGIPLPFVSSGGTSLIVSLAAIGILQSIYIRHKKITF
jgi:rod shape determining protein RodA